MLDAQRTRGAVCIQPVPVERARDDIVIRHATNPRLWVALRRGLRERRLQLHGVANLRWSAAHRVARRSEGSQVQVMIVQTRQQHAALGLYADFIVAQWQPLPDLRDTTGLDAQIEHAAT